MLTGTGDSRTEIVPVQWRKVSVAMPNPEQPADTLWVDMLRSTQWVSTAGCCVGGQVWIELEEIGYKGWAKVRAIGPCPEIAAGEGRVVTATLNHYNSFVYELKLAGTAEPLRPTDRHPIFSETRQDWVPAVDLQPGELVKTAAGSVAVESITRVPGMHRVYNMEVEGDHRYFAGEAGVLSHNACAAATLKGLATVAAKWSEVAKNPAAWLRPYKGAGGGFGHHIPAQSAFVGARGYDPNTALCVPKELLKELKVIHTLVTGQQKTGYAAFAKTGKKLGISDMKKIEVEALTKNGVPQNIAEAWFDTAMGDIVSKGAILPTFIPWRPGIPN